MIDWHIAHSQPYYCCKVTMYGVIRIKFSFWSGFATSNTQYTLECSVRLTFSPNDSRMCYNYNITDDYACEIHENEVTFKLRLTLLTTEGIHIQSNLSLTTIIIDDTAEEECCKYIHNWHVTRVKENHLMYMSILV